MTDIVERLRGPNVPMADCLEAASEIENLRATIASLRQLAGAVSIELPLMTFADIKKQAREQG